MKKRCVAKILLAIWEKFLHENNRNYNSYRFNFKFAFILFFSFLTNKCAPIIIASAIKFYLDTMQKHQVLVFGGYPQQMMVQTHPWPSHFLLFMRFGALFDVFDDVINSYLRQLSQNYSYWKFLPSPLPLWHLVRIWRQLDVKCGCSIFLYLWVFKTSFVGNWVKVFILAVMGQCTFFNFADFRLRAFFGFVFCRCCFYVVVVFFKKIVIILFLHFIILCFFILSFIYLFIYLFIHLFSFDWKWWDFFSWMIEKRALKMPW